MVSPPPQSSPFRQLLALSEILRLLLSLPWLLRQPRGSGQPVMVLPGYGTGDGVLALLRAYLRSLGYQVRGWGLGRNSGDVDGLMGKVEVKLAAFAQESGAPVTLIGWSLGGYLAREAARDLPNLVAQVITLGTPVIGGPKYTTAAHAYRQHGIDLDAVERAVEARALIPLARPVLAVWSKVDGIVAWEACIDHHSGMTEHVELPLAHVAMGFSPVVYRIIARRLAGLPVGRETT